MSRRRQSSYDGIPDGVSSPRLPKDSAQASPRSDRSDRSNRSDRSPRNSGTDVSKKSSGNIRRQKGITAADAAAKLSMPWPPVSQNIKEKSMAEGFSSSRTPSVKVSESFMNEMRSLLHAKSQGCSPRSRPLRGLHADALSETLNLIALKEQLKQISGGGNHGRKYKPSVPPKWNDVQCMWPGFDQKPVKNWKQFAIPPKIQRKVGQANSESANNTPRSRSKSGPSKPVRQRMVSQCGGCQY